MKPDAPVAADAPKSGPEAAAAQTIQARTLTSRFSSRWLAPAACLVLLGVSFAVIHARYGSLRGGLAALNGQTLIAEQSTRSFGTLVHKQRGEIPFVLWNVSSRPVRILGGETDCGCMLIYDQMPITIEPHGRRSVQVIVSPPKPGHYVGEAILYTSAPGARTLVLRVVGEVKPSDTGPG